MNNKIEVIDHTHVEVIDLRSIELGHYLQDDIGTVWLVSQEVRHFKSPTVFRFILQEHCLASRQPRTAIVNRDGSDFRCQSSPAKLIISVMTSLASVR